MWVYWNSDHTLVCQRKTKLNYNFIWNWIYVILWLSSDAYGTTVSDYSLESVNCDNMRLMCCSSLIWIGQNCVQHMFSTPVSCLKGVYRHKTKLGIKWDRTRRGFTYFWQNTCFLSLSYLPSLSSCHIQNYGGGGSNWVSWLHKNNILRHQDFHMNLENDCKQEVATHPNGQIVSLCKTQIWCILRPQSIHSTSLKRGTEMKIQMNRSSPWTNLV